MASVSEMRKRVGKILEAYKYEPLDQNTVMNIQIDFMVHFKDDFISHKPPLDYPLITEIGDYYRLSINSATTSHIEHRDYVGDVWKKV